MNMTIFHGSDHIIEKPVFREGNPYNDYGYGFYCTESSDLAKEWAVDKDHDGYANQYQIDLTDLRVLDLNKEYHLINWLAVLLSNRTFSLDTPLAKEACSYILHEFLIDTDSFDVITGYRADDSYFSFAQDFLNNTISYEQLSFAMHLGNLGEQLVIKSRRAFESLRFVAATPAMRNDWLQKKEQRDRTARNAYFQSDRMHYHRGELYVVEILDREIKKNDPRLR